MEAEQNKTVVVPASVHAMLTYLSDQDRRTIGGECSWLIEQEAARRNLKPDSSSNMKENV